MSTVCCAAGGKSNFNGHEKGSTSIRESEVSSGGKLGVGAGVTFSVAVPDEILDGGEETGEWKAVCAPEPSITDVSVEYDVGGVVEAVV